YAAWPSLGTVTNDMGVYGGSGVAYWSQGGTEIELSEHEGIQLSPVRLLSVIPNPVQSTAMIEFTLAESCLAMLKIYDITGRVVHQQENQYLNGANEIICPDLENGFYCSRIEVSNFSATRSFLVLR
ncbi:MAG: T9SS type A sorting domain-containing protein, partial [Candidatus Sabulitectum sp.]|nr:T9SS type A sorting domain-containing protein [Candidatus Sabulitectum sp.]